MNKKRYVVYEKKSVIIAIVIFSVMLLLGLFIGITNIVPPFILANKIALVIYGIIFLLLISGGFFGIIVSIEMLIFIIYNEHKENKSYETVKKKLSSDFSRVELKDFEIAKLSNFISKEDIVCIARLNEDGNIEYRITVNVESTTDNFKEFTESFYIQ